MEIEVVLPTFNGVRFLQQQIASIAAQSLLPIRVLIRDDGSTDGTDKLIQKLKMQYGDWLLVLPSDGNLGCVGNVNTLLRHTTAPYIALSDQDDFWRPDKLEKSMLEMSRYECLLEPCTPVLLHSDLALVDEKLRSLGKTFFEYQQLDPHRVSAADLSLTNVVTGCTVFCNRSLLEYALPLPSCSLMHDWWLALVASVFGKIYLLPGITVDYRQHSSNVLGATGLGLAYWRNRLRFLLNPRSAGSLRNVSTQINYFEHRYGVRISPLCSLLRLSRLSRLFVLIRHEASLLDLRKHGPLRTLGLYVLLVSLPAIDA